MATTTKEPPKLLYDKGIDIPVIGGTGEFGSGKTLFGMTIDPANTLVIDAEKSSQSYYRSLGIKKRVDLADEMLRKHSRGYKPINVWEYFRDLIYGVKPGEYTVIMVDPASDIEAGLAAWVEAHPKEFGKSAAQYQKFQTLFWQDVKDHWKVFQNDLASRCKIFYFTAHMRNEYQGERKTGQRTAKGKSTLMEMASLYLHFERRKNDKGVVPDVPSANVLKSRLAHFRNEGGVITTIPILPPRIPQATPAAICNYIDSPPDYSKLKAAEKLQEHAMSEDERLLIQSQIASDTRAAEEAGLSRAERIALAAEAQRKARESALPESSDQMHVAAARAEAIATADASSPQAEQAQPGRSMTLDTSETPDGLTDQEMVEHSESEHQSRKQIHCEIAKLWQDLGRDYLSFQKKILEDRGKEKLSDYSYEEVIGLRDYLASMVAKAEGHPF